MVRWLRPRASLLPATSRKGVRATGRGSSRVIIIQDEPYLGNLKGDRLGRLEDLGTASWLENNLIPGEVIIFDPQGR
jgi:hypothetical protein